MTVQSLRVSDNRRFLAHEDGTPFFWLGDTAWELFHRLSREEAELFLRNRAERGFRVIQAVALAEHDGLATGNAYGRIPLKLNSEGQYDPLLPDVSETEYDYWKHIDYIVDTAASLGLYIALLPTWGDKFHKAWGQGPDIFDGDNAGKYGEWLGRRYADRTNIIWVLGGDRAIVTSRHFAVVNAMAEGLKRGGGIPKLMTFHPMGGASSSLHVHDEPWLDFNMIQSSHGAGERDNYVKVSEDYAKMPVKPTLDAEPCYEDHPRGFNAENGYFDEADVRKAAYYAVFAGGFGHTYGHHSVWSMTTKSSDYFIMDWQRAIERPGAAQMQHVRALIESRSFYDRVPDQNLLASNYKGSNYMVATRGNDYAFLYCPNGLAVSVVMGKIGGDRVNASWFDPRTGHSASVGSYANEGVADFTPPTSGRGQDWVLVLDSVQ